MYANETRRLKREALRFFDLLLSVETVPEFVKDRRWQCSCSLTWFYTIIDLNWRLLEMPGKPPRKVDPAGNWKGFIECRLTADQLDGLMTWEFVDEDVWQLLISEVMGGYKFTIAYNPQNNSFVASLTGGIATANSGYTLSAFAPDYSMAVRALAYKHMVILEGDWGRSKSLPSQGIG